mmetsp:Transcript_34804/g.56134  ORF Transcript_34804/g.56134 Transcript_34804/m.56134 type:complete len:215 (-) Transcript_34804:739-1383(-)
MLCLVTLSGNVMVRAQSSGTPTSSTLRLGSGDITVLAEKSTRFPDRLPRKRPCFPFSLCTSARMGLVSRSLGSPGVSELTNCAQCCCMRFQFSMSMPRSPPFRMCVLTHVLTWMISAILTVRSSSLVPEPWMEVGLRQTGGMSILFATRSSGRPFSIFWFKSFTSASGIMDRSLYALIGSISSRASARDSKSSELCFPTRAPTPGFFCFFSVPS